MWVSVILYMQSTLADMPLEVTGPFDPVIVSSDSALQVTSAYMSLEVPGHLPSPNPSLGTPPAEHVDVPMEVDLPTRFTPALTPEPEAEIVPGKHALPILPCLCCGADGHFFYAATCRPQTKLLSNRPVVDEPTPMVLPPAEGNNTVTPAKKFTWPANTNLVFPPNITKVMLTHQSLLFRAIMQDAFNNIRLTLLFQHAFPGLALSQAYARDALLAAAEAHRPGATAIYRRLQHDANYLADITPLVSFSFLSFRKQI